MKLVWLVLTFSVYISAMDHAQKLKKYIIYPANSSVDLATWNLVYDQHTFSNDKSWKQIKNNANNENNKSSVLKQLKTLKSSIKNEESWIRFEYTWSTVACYMSYIPATITLAKIVTDYIYCGCVDPTTLSYAIPSTGLATYKFATEKNIKHELIRHAYSLKKIKKLIKKAHNEIKNPSSTINFEKENDK